jgi:transposase, IS30 family
MKKHKKTHKKLGLEERITIEIHYCHNNKSLREIATLLGRNVSTISNEVKGKNRHGRNRYKAYVAHNKALFRREKREPKELLKCGLIRVYVKEHLQYGWSPEQIAIRLPIDKPGYSISYEAIYQYVFSTYKEEDLRPYLPRRRRIRMKKGLRKIQKLERMQSLPSIEDRPSEVNKRKVIGHWEDDCIVSRESKDRLKTVNERVSGIVFISKMKNGTKEESNKAVIGRLQAVPALYRKTLTRDRGSENMGYREIERKLHLSCFFAHPYASYERGSNENTNGLIRRYFPKGTDFSTISYEEIQKVEYLLNTRPRKRLGGLTPYEVFYNRTGVALRS